MAAARSPWFSVATVCVGAFMGQLDASIAQLVLPTLQSTFHARLSTVSWVALMYLIVLAATLPIFGRLADLFGRKRLYTGGFIVFIAGSAGCGMAPTLAFLVAMRAVQALGAGLLQSNSIAIITTAAGPAMRGRALGVQGAAQALGLSLGPALGGLLISLFGWRGVFWINVPFGIGGTILAAVLLAHDGHAGRTLRGFHWLGAALLAPGIALLILAISEMATWGAGSPAFLGALAAGAILIAAFVLSERRTRAPLVDLSLFGSRTFSAGNLAGLISYALLFGVFLLLPFALERGYGDTPLRAGLRLTAIPIALAVAAPFSGALSDRLGPRALTVGGMLLAALALGGLGLTLDGRPATSIIVTLALVGFGIGEGLFTAPNNSAIMGAAPVSRHGAAGGVLNVMRALGTTLGVAVATLLLESAIAAIAGRHEGTSAAVPGVLLPASREVLLVFSAAALAAAAISLFGGRRMRHSAAISNA